jgi:hypothetical protein
MFQLLPIGHGEHVLFIEFQSGVAGGHSTKVVLLDGRVHSWVVGSKTISEGQVMFGAAVWHWLIEEL